MLLTIVRKELCEVRRDPCTWGVLGIYVTVLALSCVASQWTWTERVSAQVSSQRQAREAWLTQASASPHQATHNGTTVYKIPSPLGSVDPGVDPELGMAVKLESHRRHEGTNALRPDRLRLLRLDFTTPALLIQAVFPLVVILITHALVSREREHGTWGLLASLGVTRRRATLGKLITAFLLTVAITVPVLIALISTVMSAEPGAGMPWTELLYRVLAVYAVNLAYLAGWCAAGAALSARFSSGASLVLLISCWAGWTLIIPRLAVDLAYSRFPLPSRQSMLEARDTALRQGSDGRHSLEEFNTALEQQLLQEYGVTRLQDLPINLNAARLLAMEQFTDSIDDHALSQLADIYRRQNRFIELFQTVSPYLTIRSVSASFAGTDCHHHDAFIASAEQYRRLLVKTMNTAEMNGERPGTTAESQREFWRQVPEFQHRFPPPIRVLDAAKLPIGLLAVWCLSMTIFALLP
jgi:ABC-2 type transport system permease protein